MTHDSLDEQPENTPDNSVPEAAEPSTPVLTSPEPTAWTAERVLDVTLGLASVTAEAATNAIQKLGVEAKALQDNAPAIRDALEERGRPIREQLVTKIRETLPTKNTAGDSASESGEPSNSAPSSSSPSVATPSNAVPADQEIAALEQRVRELEQQMSQPIVEEEAAASSLVLVESGETPAEEATFVPDGDAPTALADSEYAVSETDSEAAAEVAEAGYMESPTDDWPAKDQESGG